MALGREFYLARAAEDRASANAATLDNVRERWLRSAANWSEMAARSDRSEKMHATLMAEKEATSMAEKERNGEAKADRAWYRPNGD